MNVGFTTRFACGDIVFRALRDIAMGEQIFIEHEWPNVEYNAFRR